MIKENTPFELRDLMIKGDDIIKNNPKINIENIDTLLNKYIFTSNIGIVILNDKGEIACATGKNYKDVKPKMVGGLHTQIPDLDEIVDGVVKDQFIKLYQTAQEQLKESQNLIPKKAEYKYIPSVQGKIDVMGLTANLEIKSNLSDMEKDIVEALKNIKNNGFQTLYSYLRSLRLRKDKSFPEYRP